MTGIWDIPKIIGVLIFSLLITTGYVSPLLAEEAKETDKTVEDTVEVTKAEDIDDDPFEGINRFTFGFNQIFRGIILDPLIDGYQAVTPEPMQEALGNAASNLSEPATAISSLLQGDSENASNATKRFFINSTVGLGGLNDQATEMGIVQRREDLGQAAAVQGAKAGPYIVLPILGPSNSRDALGTALTAVANPLPLVGAAAATGVEYSQNQDDINSITKGALDPYTVEKNAYRQYRTFQINNGEVEAEQDFPSLDKTD